MPETLRDLIDRYGRRRSAIIAAIGVLTLLAIIGLSRWATAPAWVPLMPDMTVDEVAAVAAVLDENGVRYTLRAGGSRLEVADADLARARVLLAQNGGLPQRGAPGFELFDRPSWGMTDFTQRINYRRALEGELERTIGRMDGVEAAQVHLAMNETSSFRARGQDAAASVVLTLRSNTRPTADFVEGIASLVSSSVGNLAPDRVAVLDHQGRLLSGAVDAAGVSGAASRRQLALRREVESYLEQKAEDLVARVMGPGNVRVSVAAEINFDRVDRTVQKVNPDDQTPTRQERTDIIPAEGQVAASSSAISSEFETSRTIETFSGAVGGVSRLTVAVLLNETPDSTGVPIAPGVVQQVEALVANAVGLDTQRGDAISVIAVPFGSNDVPVVVAPPVTIIERVQEIQRPLVGLIAILIAAFIGWQALRAVRGERPTEQEPVALPSAAPAAAPAVPVPTQSPVLASGPHVDDPEMAARVIRAWIRE
jgi:flagellar M-ring protein FliF